MVISCRSALGIAVFVAFAVTASAQGVQTGVLTGVAGGGGVFSLPGATVSVASPAIQGTRGTTTDNTGAYVIRGLPPGTYEVTFEFPDMEPVTRQAIVSL